MTGPVVGPEAGCVAATQLAQRLDVDPACGLTAAEAAERLAAEGPNELRAAAGVPWWHVLLGQVRDPLVALLAVAAGVSTAAWVAEGAAGAPVDALVIAAILVANALIGFVQERRVERAVAALAELTAATASVLRDGALGRIPARELVVGDVLALAEGDAVAADARLLSASALLVQESALTGESAPVDKTGGVLAGELPLAERHNMVFRGSAVVRGVGRALVTATGMDTEVGRIADLLDRTESEPSPLQRELARLTRTLGLGVLAVAAVVVGTLAVVNGVHDLADLETVLLLGLSLAVAAVPEGLPAVLSLVLALGVRAMARRQAVVKSLPSVETLGSATVVCSDKTGTLTRNEMTLASVASAGGELELVDGVWTCRSGDEAAALEEAEGVLLSGMLANNAQLAHGGDGRAHGDPTELAILAAAAGFGRVTRRADRHERVAETPFSSERKLMSTVTREPDGRRTLHVKGAPDVLVAACDRVWSAGESRPLTDAGRSRVLAQVDRLSAAAYRTLAMARRRLADDEPAEGAAEERLELLGVVGLIDPPRPESRQAVAEAQRAGVRVVMITGDHPSTAARIAADLGIVAAGAEVLTGPQLERMDEADLRSRSRVVSVYARVSPEHKLRIVDALQANGEVVAMTGDGVNDAPALKSADIGVAMGRGGTEVAKQAATMILGDDDFATIVAAIRQGRVIFDNISKFLRYLLASNLGEVTAVFLGVVLADLLGLTGAAAAGTVVLPLLATQILWVNLVTDSGPALALGVDPEIDDVMARPPRGLGQPILDLATWRRVLVVGLALGLATLATIDRFLPGGLLAGSESLDTARTVGFTTLVLAQLLLALSARSLTGSALRRLGSNRWLLAALGLGAALQVAVVELPPLQRAFGTTSMSPGQWLWATAAAASVLAVAEVEKLVGRRR